MNFRIKLRTVVACAAAAGMLITTAACSSSPSDQSASSDTVNSASETTSGDAGSADTNPDTTPTQSEISRSDKNATSGNQSESSGTTTDVSDLKDVKLARLGPSSLLWQHAVARKLELYKKHGVNVTTAQVQSSAALVQAVSSGSADAGASLGDNVITAIDKGAPIIITGSMVQKAALRMFGVSDVDTIGDLKGAKVSAGAVSGGTADLLLYQLQNAGVSASDVTLVAITNSKDRVVALKNGQIKGSLLIPPYDTLAKSQGDKMLGWYDKPYIETPLIVNTDWASEHPVAATGLTQALSEAAKWLYDPDNKDQAEQILEDYTGVSSEAASDAYQFLIADGKVLSPDLALNGDGLQNIVDVTAAVHDKKAPKLDISKYYDPSYLQGEAK